MARGPDGHGAETMRATPAIRRPITIPVECPVTGSGIWRDAKWHGKARPFPRYARRSKIPPRNGGRKIKELVDDIGKDTLVGWAWTPGLQTHAGAGRAGEGRRSR